MLSYMVSVIGKEPVSKGLLSSVNENTLKVPIKEITISNGVATETVRPDTEDRQVVLLDSEDLKEKMRPLVKDLVTECMKDLWSRKGDSVLCSKYFVRANVDTTENHVIIYPFGKKYNPENPISMIQGEYEFRVKIDDQLPLIRIPQVDHEGQFLSFDLPQEDTGNKRSIVLEGYVEVKHI